MHCGKKWWIREFVAPYIFPLNPDYVAARSLRSLRSNYCSARAQSSAGQCLRDYMFLSHNYVFVLKLRESLLKSLKIAIKKIVKYILRYRKTIWRVSPSPCGLALTGIKSPAVFIFIHAGRALSGRLFNFKGRYGWFRKKYSADSFRGKKYPALKKIYLSWRLMLKHFYAALIALML